MRSKLGKALRQRFAAALGAALPQFEPDRDSELPEGWLSWRWSAHDDLHLFVALVVSRSFDDFSVECAWNVKPVLPQTFDDDVAGEQGVFRLHHLWAPRQATGWTLVPGRELGAPFDPLDDALLFEDPPVEDGLARVPQVVEDAIAKLVEHGLPRFAEVAAARGRVLPAG